MTGGGAPDFGLDPDVPDDIAFDVGQKVSVGLSQLKIGSGGAWLREISIVRHGAVAGAEITSRYAYERDVSTSRPARPPASDRTEGEVIYGGQTIHRVFIPPKITIR